MTFWAGFFAGFFRVFAIEEAIRFRVPVGFGFFDPLIEGLLYQQGLTPSFPPTPGALARPPKGRGQGRHREPCAGP